MSKAGQVTQALQKVLTTEGPIWLTTGDATVNPKWVDAVEQTLSAIEETLNSPPDPLWTEEAWVEVVRQACVDTTEDYSHAYGKLAGELAEGVFLRVQRHLKSKGDAR